MSSTGTRVVPTLTEVLDEQRLAKPASVLGTEAWRDSRGDEELVPISLDWGDEPVDAAPAAPTQDAEAAMTPWQVVQPHGLERLDDAPFIDLSIDVAPVQAPALHEQVLEVLARPPGAPVLPASPEDSWAPLRPTDAAPVADAVDAAGVPPSAWPATLTLSADTASTGGFAQPQPADEVPVEGAGPAEPVSVDPSPAAPSPTLPTAQQGEATEFLTPSRAGTEEAAAAKPQPAPARPSSPVPAAVLNVLAAADAAAKGPAPSASSTLSALSSSSRAFVPLGAGPALDPGMHAVRQGGEHVPGLSEERLQAILQQALDRVLRDELPSALVETLIRMSPQLSESLIESLKPSLHLHVLEALSAEPLVPPARALD